MRRCYTVATVWNDPAGALVPATSDRKRVTRHLKRPTLNRYTGAAVATDDQTDRPAASASPPDADALRAMGGEMAATCAGFNLRRASRAVSQHFDHALAPAGLRMTQFTLLGAIALAGSTTTNILARALVIDRTTLTRNLRLLRDAGLIASADGARRTRAATVADAGRRGRAAWSVSPVARRPSQHPPGVRAGALARPPGRPGPTRGWRDRRAHPPGARGINLVERPGSRQRGRRPGRPLDRLTERPAGGRRGACDRSVTVR